MVCTSVFYVHLAQRVAQAIGGGATPRSGMVIVIYAQRFYCNLIIGLWILVMKQPEKDWTI